ncbi:hypothetical protein BDK51DRAFT_34639, partial [Blyttiomyces helicus]
MSNIIRDLKGTHFTLGNDPSPHFTSQYQGSFRKGVAAPHTGPGHKIRYIPSYVLDETHDGRRTGTSSSRDDYVSPRLRQGGEESGCGVHIQRPDGRTSITFGTDSTSPDGSRSVIMSDFPPPLTRDATLTAPGGAYDPAMRTRAHRAHPFPSPDPIKVDVDPRREPPRSEAMDGFAARMDEHMAETHAATRAASDAVKVFLRGHHFALGSDGEGSGRFGGGGATCSREHFRDPEVAKRSARAWREDTAGAGSSGTGMDGLRVCDEGYEVTRANTVT